MSKIALRDRKGRFELARGGTLFLDEVTDLSKPMQAKLLWVLQEGTFEMVGSEKTISTDARIISAANRDLKQEMEKGNFREDHPSVEKIYKHLQDDFPTMSLATVYRNVMLIK